jgi:cell division septation protein DedD
MARNDEGEFELILGNRQLLSVFFLVVVLLGVFFTMGYIVGRNTGPVGVADVPAKTRTEPASDPVVIDPAKGKSSPAGEPAPQRTLENIPVTAPAPQQSAPATQPTAAPVQRAESRPVAPAAKPVPVPTAPANPATAAPAPASGRLLVPPGGSTYLQVTALARSEAELVADVLRRKGFKAAVSPGPTDKVFRVLVGPVGDTGEIVKTKSGLEAAGFSQSIVRHF